MWKRCRRFQPGEGPSRGLLPSTWLWKPIVKPMDRMQHYLSTFCSPATRVTMNIRAPRWPMPPVVGCYWLLTLCAKLWVAGHGETCTPILLGRASNNMVTLLHIHTLVLLGENNLIVLVDASSSKYGIITSNLHVCNSGSVVVKCLLTATGHCNAVLVPGIWSLAWKYVAGCEECLSYQVIDR